MHVSCSQRSWYFVNWAGESQGPLDEIALAEKLLSKEITADTRVWNGTAATKWTRLSNVPGLLPRLRRKSRGFSMLDARLKKVCSLAVRENSDLVILVSDLSDSETSSSDSGDTDDDSFHDSLDELEEKCPVFACRQISGVSTRSVTELPAIQKLTLARSSSSVGLSLPALQPSLSLGHSSDAESEVAGLPKGLSLTGSFSGLSLGSSAMTMPCQKTLRLTPKSSEAPLCLADEVFVHACDSDDAAMVDFPSAMTSEHGLQMWDSSENDADDESETASLTESDMVSESVLVAAMVRSDTVLTTSTVDSSSSMPDQWGWDNDLVTDELEIPLTPRSCES